MQTSLDEIDRELLDIIQSEFPLLSRPYAFLGERVGISEDEALARINAMRSSGLIRRLGANYQSSKIGFVSSLCAASVPQDKLEAFIERINAEPGVTHNYEREHHFNIWFTFISSSKEDRLKKLREITRETGIEILDLPASRLYKIRVDFKMSE